MRLAAVWIVVVLAWAQIAHAQTPTALAPILVGPYDGKEVEEDIIVWSWFMQPRASNGSPIICDLTLAEILEGQTPEEALRRNPLIINRKNLETSAWQTNFATRDLISGRRYAWRIIAKAEVGGRVTVLSASEIWSFTFRNPIDRMIAESTPSSDITVKEEPITAEDILKEADDTAPGIDSLNDEASAATEEHTDTQPEESTPPPVSFSGSVVGTGERADNAGVLAETPTTLGRVVLTPTVQLYGVPFTAQFVVSSEENPRSSSVSRGVFSSATARRGIALSLQQRVSDEVEQLQNFLDTSQVDTLREFRGMTADDIQSRLDELRSMDLQDPSPQTVEMLKSMGLATETESAISSIPAFGFGAVAPQYTPLLFSQTTINGGMAEYNPGIVYVSAAMGKLQRDFNSSTLPIDAEAIGLGAEAGLDLYRNAYIARLGIGQRNESHLIASVVHAEDDAQSLALMGLINNTDTARPVPIAPKQYNTVFGLSGRYRAPELGAFVEGEFNVSRMHTPGIVNPLRNAEKIDMLFGDLFSRYLDSATVLDQSFALRAGMRSSDAASELQAGLRYVGGGYESIGLVGLRKDVLQGSVTAKHALFDNALRAHGSFSYDEAGYKLDPFNRSILRAGALGMMMALPSWPVLNAQYSRNVQQLITTAEDTPEVRSELNSIENISLTGHYGTALGSMRYFVYAQWTHQNGNTTVNEVVDSTSPGVFSSSVAVISQRLALNDVLTVGAALNHSATSTALGDNADITSADVSLMLSPWPILETSLGLGIRNSGISSVQSIFFTARATVMQRQTVELRMDYRNFDGEQQPADFSGFVARLVTTVQW